MQSWIVLGLAALICASASFYVMGAYRRADGGTAAKPVPALIACAAAAAAALGLYLVIGKPALPDAPYAARMEALRHRAPESFSLEETLAVLGQAARDHPGDPRPHIFTGDILLQTGRPQDAARAYDAALRRDPHSFDALLGMGRALVQVEEGRVSPEALQVFRAAAEARPGDPTPWVYQAMAAMQQGHQADAARFWGEAGRRMPPDDPRRVMAERMSQGQTN